MNEEQRDELLIRLDERQQSMHECLKSHLAKHWKIELMAIGSVLSLLGAVLVSLLF